MLIKQRIKNAFMKGGMLELFRKLVFKCIYRFNSFFTKIYVETHKTPDIILANEKREEAVVVSLTSFPARLPFLHKCLKSICLQDIKPDYIEVHFGSDVNREMLGQEILAFEKKGVSLLFHDEDIKSHKKYYYSLQNHKDCVLVTADDDVYYPKSWLKKLLNTHKKYPSCVCAWRLHKIKEKNGSLLPYNYWIDQYRRERRPSFSLFPTGVGGVLYPIGCFDERVFEKETFLSICLGADDVWLKIMYTLTNTKVVWVKNNQIELREIEKKQSFSLSSTNVYQNKNDEYIKAVMTRYNVNCEVFFR